MYINNKELSDIKQAIEKLQYIIDEQNETQNRYFPEGIHLARESANDCEEHINRVYEREAIKRAKQIVKKRALANKS